MKISKETLLLSIFTVMSYFLACELALAADPTPNNYGDVKALLDKYASQIDLPTEESIAARNAMKAKADQAVPALKILFDETPYDRYRVEIVSLFRYTSSSRKDAMSFLSARLRDPRDQLHGHRWIRAAFEVLSEFDAEDAKIAARNALNSSDPHIQVAAIQTLARVGDNDDAKRMDSYVTEHSKGDVNNYDALVSEAKVAAGQVRKRLSR